MKKALIAVAVAAGLGTGTSAGASAAPAVPDGAAEAFVTWAHSTLGVAAIWSVTCVGDPFIPDFFTCYGLVRDYDADTYRVVAAQATVYGELATSSWVGPLEAATAAEAGAPADSTAGDTATSFGGGTWMVGADIQPGTYRTTVPGGSYNCYWERLGGFSGDIGDLLANDNSDAGEQVIVEIQSSDVGFSSSGCGTWERIG